MVSISPYGFVQKEGFKAESHAFHWLVSSIRKDEVYPVYEDIIVTKAASRPSGVSPGGGGGSGEPVIAKVVITGERDDAYPTHTRSHSGQGVVKPL